MMAWERSRRRGVWGLIAAAGLVVAGAGCKRKSPVGADASVDAGDASALGDGGIEAGAASVVDAAAAAEAPAPPPPVNAPLTTTFVAGETWNGAFACKHKQIALHLVIVRGAPGVEAIFTFTTHEKVSGSFKATGLYEAGSRHLRLTGRDWIAHPPGFQLITLDGRLTADGRTFTGHASGGTGCTTFGVSR